MSISSRGEALSNGAWRTAPVATWRSGSLRWGFVAVVAGIVGLATNSQAKAQITVKALLKNSVSDVNEDSDYAKDIQDAITRFTNRDAKGALGQLESAKKKNKQLPPADMMLAQMWLMANQGGPARGALEECIKENPTDPEAYLVLADLAFSDRQITASELLFGKAKELTADFKENPKRANDFKGRAEAGLAAVAESREQWDLAKKYLEAWLKVVDPTPSLVKSALPNSAGAAAHDRLGRVLFHLDSPTASSDASYTDAFEQFKLAVACDTKSVSPRIALAVLFEDAKQHEKAKELIALAVSHMGSGTDPDTIASNEATLLAAARWALDTNQGKEAFEYAKRAVDANPKSKRALEAKYYMGVAARMNGDTKAAEDALSEVYMAAPSNFAASNQLAQVLVEQQDPEKKQRGLEIAINNQAAVQGERNQRDPARAIEAASTLGWAFYLLDRINEADQVTQAVLNQSVNASPDIWYYRAKLFDYHSKRDDAISSLKVATNSRGFFIHRDDAKRLLEKLSSTQGSNSPGAGTTTTNGAGAGNTPAAGTGTGKTDDNPTKTDSATDKGTK